MGEFVLRAAKERIRWPRERTCRDQREADGGLDCICRGYDGADGYYTIDPDGHAVGYHLRKPDAREYCTRLNEALAAAGGNLRCRECGCSALQACRPYRCAWVLDPATGEATDLCTRCAKESVR